MRVLSRISERDARFSWPVMNSSSAGLPCCVASDCLADRANDLPGSVTRRPLPAQLRRANSA